MARSVSRRECLKCLSQVSYVSAAISALSNGRAEGQGKISQKTIRIIDPHVHIWKNDLKYPWAKETTQPPKEDALPESLLELMKVNGVSKTVIIQVIYYRWDNSYMFDVIKRYSKTFRGVCRVNPESPTAPDDLTKLSKLPGYAGVRLSPAAGAEGDWITRPLMEPLWKRTQELGGPMTILTSTPRLPDIARLIERHPDMNVVIDHMADCPIDRPEELQKLLGLARFPRVYVKVSHMWKISKQAYPYPDTHEMVHRIYDQFGPQRLMWATDWPLVEQACGYAKALALVRDELKFLNAEDKEWMLGKTIEQVWPFPA